MSPSSRSVSRCTAAAMLLALPFQIAFAGSGEILISQPQSIDAVNSIIDAGSANTAIIQQLGGTAADQNAQLTGSAATVVDSTQTVDTEHEVVIGQECLTGSGSQLCFQDASPVVATVVAQEIDASSANVLGAAQAGGTGSTQNILIAADAATNVTASQTVTPESIVAIFQDCSMGTGTCVQRALPEILTLASQVITASALNQIAAVQIAGSGSAQDVTIDAAANVEVNAQQYVSPRNFLYLSQLCALDIGLCIQRAIPVITTAVRQVILAQTGNGIGVLQAGGWDQNVVVGASADTDVNSQQTVLAETEIHTMQHCLVGQGLCLQVDESGRPLFVFSDGETTASGTLASDFDESALANDYSRATVAKVAGGICGGGASCSMLEKLLFWLFGPEPQTVSQFQRPERQDSEDSARRGHQTNVISASAKFLAKQMGAALPAPSFGGGEQLELTDGQKSLFCSMREAIPEGSDEGVWSWTAGEMATLTGLNPAFAEQVLRDASVCDENVAQEDPRLAKLAQVTFFPVDETGPVSSNLLWNYCVRGLNVSHAMIQANPDQNRHSCGDYHTQTSWYHPDLGIFFTWDRQTGELKLPEGYLPTSVVPTL
jgi:hypothetical protein